MASSASFGGSRPAFAALAIWMCLAAMESSAVPACAPEASSVADCHPDAGSPSASSTPLPIALQVPEADDMLLLQVSMATVTVPGAEEAAAHASEARAAVAQKVEELPEIWHSKQFLGWFTICSVYTLACAWYALSLAQEPAKAADAAGISKPVLATAKESAPAAELAPEALRPAVPAPVSAPAPPKARVPMWDVMRVIIENVVIMNHCILYATQQPGMYDGVITQWSWLGRSFRMPCFAFISGVFGSNSTPGSYTRMLCYTLGTSCIACYMHRLAVDYEHHDPVINDFTKAPSAMSVWFLFSIFLWRTLITPIFSVLSKHGGLPTFIPLAISLVLLYPGRHLIATVTDQHSYIDRIQKTCFYGQFFALGMSISRQNWELIFTRSTVQVLGLILFVTWQVLVRTNDAVFEWDPWNMKTQGSHFPDWSVDGTLSSDGFKMDMVLFALQSVLSLSVLAMITWLSRLLADNLPYVASCVAGWGSRTLYAYVLHPFLIMSFRLAGGAELFHTSTMTPSRMLLGCFVLGTWMNVVLCTKLSERLMKWAMLPYWLTDIVDFVFRPCCPFKKLVGMA